MLSFYGPRAQQKHIYFTVKRRAIHFAADGFFNRSRIPRGSAMNASQLAAANPLDGGTQNMIISASLSPNVEAQLAPAVEHKHTNGGMEKRVTKERGN
jgi:hypothetical protein